LVGEALLKHFTIAPGSRAAHALSHLDYVAAATQYGRVGGFSHLATLIKRLRADRPGALLLDGGDLWQGSATALWTEGQDMVDASQLLGVDVMTGHWEFTLGAERVMDILDNELKGQVEFIAHNVKDMDFGDPIFASHTVARDEWCAGRHYRSGFSLHALSLIPAYFTPGWTFGIQERELQEKVNEVKAAGAQVVVLLSHNGADADIKLASAPERYRCHLGGSYA
jgi:sulfur-oxidizing protein SoxB